MRLEERLRSQNCVRMEELRGQEGRTVSSHAEFLRGLPCNSAEKIAGRHTQDVEEEGETLLEKAVKPVEVIEQRLTTLRSEHQAALEGVPSLSKALEELLAKAQEAIEGFTKLEACKILPEGKELYGITMGALEEYKDLWEG